MARAATAVTAPGSRYSPAAAPPTPDPRVVSPSLTTPRVPIMTSVAWPALPASTSTPGPDPGWGPGPSAPASTPLSPGGVTRGVSGAQAGGSRSGEGTSWSSASPPLSTTSDLRSGLLEAVQLVWPPGESCDSFVCYHVGVAVCGCRGGGLTHSHSYAHAHAHAHTHTHTHKRWVWVRTCGCVLHCYPVCTCPTRRLCPSGCGCVRPGVYVSVQVCV